MAKARALYRFASPGNGWRLLVFAAAGLLSVWVVLSIDSDEWNRGGREDLNRMKGDLADFAAATIFVAVAFQAVLAGAFARVRSPWRNAARSVTFVIVAAVCVGAKEWSKDFGILSWPSVALAVGGALVVLVCDFLADRQVDQTHPELAENADPSYLSWASSCIYRLDDNEQWWIAKGQEGASWHFLQSPSNDYALLAALHRLLRGACPDYVRDKVETVSMTLGSDPAATVVLDWDSTARLLVQSHDGHERRATFYLRGGTELQAGADAVLDLLSKQLYRCEKGCTSPYRPRGLS